MPKQIGFWDVGNRTVALSAALLLSGVLNGCYEFVPAPSDAVAPGQPIALEINDQGRVGLGNLIGAEVRRLSGTLISESDQQYEMRVTELTFLNDRTSQWIGEHLTVPKQYARTVFEQRLSRGRTFMAAAISAGLIVAGILSSSLSGRGGNDGVVGKPPPPPPTT